MADTSKSGQIPGDGIRDAIKALQDVIAKMPDALAGAFSNTIGRTMAGFREEVAGARGGGVSPGEPAGPGEVGAMPGFDGAFRRSVASIFDPLIRRMMRDDRATVGPAPAGPKFYPAHKDFGKVNWGEVLGRTSGPHQPRGPGATSFQHAGHTGDVMDEVRQRQIEKDALHASYNLGSGFKFTPKSVWLANAVDKAKMIGQSAPGGASFNQGFPQNTGKQSPGSDMSSRFFSRLWSDMSASWRSMAADFRHFTKYPIAAASGVRSNVTSSRAAQAMSGAWAQVVTSKFGRTVARGDASFHKFRAAPFLNTAKGIGRVGRYVGRAADAFGRRARRAAVTFGKHYTWAGGGRGFVGRTFRSYRNTGRAARKFGGAWKRAAAIGGIRGTAALMGLSGGAFGTVITATIAAVNKSREHAEGQYAANHRFAMVNGAAAQAYAYTGVNDFFRLRSTAKENEKTTVTLARSVNGMRDAFRPLESLGTAISNRTAIMAGNSAASFMRMFNPIIEGVRQGIESADPAGAVSSGIGNKVWQGLHGTAGAVGNTLLGLTTGGLYWALGGNSPITAGNNWSKAEMEAQIRDARKPADEAWNGLIRMGWPDRPLMVPARRLLPPRRRRP